MCGIAGIYHLDGAPINLAQLQRMAGLLRHRGPDDEGFALFNTQTGAALHLKGPDSPPGVDLPDMRTVSEQPLVNLGLVERRLAILDLSPAGHTPMTTADGALTLCFNGEIYNYIELRAELVTLGHAFRSSGDTEVLLAAYRQWGEACVQRFNGMWAFALWDAQRRVLFCSRDRFGVKPFYYVKTPTLFAFASEPKALWASGLIPPQVDEIILEDFLAGYEASRLDGTMFANIRQLPGGHSLSISEGAFVIKRYWSLPVNPDIGPAQPDDGPAQRVLELLTDAVRLRLRSDVPVGTCLSGGLDSSAIVALVNVLMQTEHGIPREQLGARQKTFTAAYEDHVSDERRFAQIVVEQTGAEWHCTFPTAEGLRADLERFVWHHDEPPITTSMYAQWCVMRLAREHGVTVLLDGQGSDELLAGYLPFDVWVSQLLRAGRWRQLWRETLAIRRVGSRSLAGVLARAVAYQLPSAAQRWVQQRWSGRMTGLRAGVAERAMRRRRHAFPPETYAHLPSHLAHLTLYNLPRLLRAEDRNSMAFSIEARTPFLDVRLAEYISQLPAVYRIHAGWSKYVLRRAIRNLLPSAIVWRRDKKGFVTPEQAWMRALRPFWRELFHDRPRLSDWLDVGLVRKMLAAESTPDASIMGANLWRWGAAEVWLRQIERCA
ncbi:asparagine synthase (glutamine-hydrolyzing) [Candidatus Roseilinea sp. NK_OTU-006]|jgi:asparagine synthase (glutamine-hydrolysing)|uniref:asparagine synthase (glutamine-hydrolyzing) n=1 Tax=Candidatus Roseilinea sp. NK_OTU-006 TaxID=2704250 RepID=UPI00145EE7C9|nr:asparagine synthase (glutamine-hydrolyzing) [Candidatus Roseilinea sp. NK_OTU-006]